MSVALHLPKLTLELLETQGVYISTKGKARSGKTAFMFPGHGAQYPNMLKDLAVEYASVRETLEEADEVYRELTGSKLTQHIFYNNEEQKIFVESSLKLAEVMQPSIYTANMAVFRLFKEMGIQFDICIGHSLGEIAALAASGVISFKDGLKIAYHRATSLNQIDEKKRGGMISLKLKREDPLLRELLSGLSGYFTLSLHNSPEQVVISGETDAIKEIAAKCQEKGITSHVLHVSHAFHSELLRPAVKYFEEKLKDFSFKKPEVPVFSTISGQFYSDETDSTTRMAAFLSSQLVTPFSFCDIVSSLYKNTEVQNFIEIGPKDILTKLVKEILKGKEGISCCASNIPALGDLVSLERVKAYMKINELGKKESAGNMITKATENVNRKDNDITSQIKNIIQLDSGYPKSMIQVSSEPLILSLALNGDIFNKIIEKIRKKFNLREDELPANETISFQKIFNLIVSKPEYKSFAEEPVKVDENKSVEQSNAKVEKPANLSVNMSREEVEKEVKQIIQLKTGYPVEMLESDLDLEADLGIDSVKQAEIFVQVRQKYGYEPEPNLNVKQFNTISKILDYTIKRVTELTGDDVVESPCKIPENAKTQLKRDDAENEVKGIIQSKTGYPVEMLESDLDLEADLGIDSVKQAEIFVQVRQKYGYEPDPNLNVKQFNTISKIIDYTVRRVNELIGDAMSETMSEVALSTEIIISRDETEKEVKTIIQLKTGYPVEMLESDLDLEADLGIDSVKQAEIFVQVRQKYGYEPEPNLNIKQFNTISKVVDYTIKRITAEGSIKTSEAPVVEEDKIIKEKILNYSEEENTGRHIAITVERPYDTKNGKSYSFENKNIIVVEDRISGEITERLSKILAEKGAKINIIAENPEKYTEKAIKTDFSSKEQITAAFETAKGNLKAVHGLVNLYPLRENFSYFEADQKEWEKEVENSFSVLFYGVKAIYEDLEKAGESCGCFAATNIGGIFGLEEGVSENPVGALTAGFYKSLEKEIKPFNGKVVDFTDTCDRSFVAQTLVKEFSLIEELIEIGYNGQRRKTICVIPKKVDIDASARSIKLTQDDVIVVSGGGRGIIFESVKGLAELFNPNIIVTGRTELPKGDEAWLKMSEKELDEYGSVYLREMKAKNPKMSPLEIKMDFEKLKSARTLYLNIEGAREAGYKMQYMACDVADRASVSELYRKVKAQFGKITGIVNGAGLGSFGKVPKKPERHTLNVVRVKAHGFYNLYHEFKNEPLKFFMSIGSISGRFGMDGQVDYAAAADIISRMSFQMVRERPDLQSFVIGWTAWEDVGMAADPDVQKVQKETRGLTYVGVREGVQKFLNELVYGGNYPEIIVYGELGANKPLGQGYLLDESHKKVELTYGEDGIVYNRINYPHLERVQNYVKGVELSALKQILPNEDIYLKDHQVEGRLTFPGVMHIESYCELGALMNELESKDLLLSQVCDVEFKKFVKYFDNKPLALKINGSLTRNTDTEREYKVEIRSDFCNEKGIVLESNRLHSCGSVIFSKERKPAAAAGVNIQEAIKNATPMDIEKFYTSAESYITFGDTFRYLNYAGYINENEMIGEVTVTDDRFDFSFTCMPEMLISPITIDSAARCTLLGDFHENGYIIVPQHIKTISLYRPFKKHEKVYIHYKILEHKGDTIVYDLQILDQGNKVIFDMNELTLIRINKQTQDHLLF